MSNGLMGDDHTSLHASFVHGALSGLYFGSLWGVAMGTTYNFKKEAMTRVVPYTAVGLMRAVGGNALIFGTFYGLFKGIHWTARKSIPDATYRPLVAGASAGISWGTVAFAVTSCVRTARGNGLFMAALVSGLSATFLK